MQLSSIIILIIFASPRSRQSESIYVCINSKLNELVVKIYFLFLNLRLHYDCTQSFFLTKLPRMLERTMDTAICASNFKFFVYSHKIL